MINLATFEETLRKLDHIVWGWPIVIFILLGGFIFSFAFNFVQVRHFFTGWKLLFAQEKTEQKKDTISPLQAFINALSASLGNGGFAGMATVLVDGGPGTAFWVFILGFFGMILRFTEVYAATKYSGSSIECGPLRYIKKMPLGKFLVYIYALLMFIFILVAGNAMQCNSIGLSMQAVTGWSFYTIATIFCFLVLYIMLGGSQRIMRASQAIIPVKVCLFFFAIIVVILYNAAEIPNAMRIILANALQWPSLAKGVVIYNLQHAISIGFSRALNATEAGLGTAGIFFGSTETKMPLRTAIMSLITAFISTNLVCTSLIVALVSSGAWQSGLTSTPLVIKAFSSTFGSFAGPLVTFLSCSFGLGVLVAYSFLGNKIWVFLFGERTLPIYVFLFTATAFFGTISSVGLIWVSIGLIVAFLIMINISALLWILPELRSNFKKDYKELFPKK